VDTRRRLRRRLNEETRSREDEQRLSGWVYYRLHQACTPNLKYLITSKRGALSWHFKISFCSTS